MFKERKTQKQDFREDIKTSTLKYIKIKTKRPMHELAAREKISDLEIT